MVNIKPITNLVANSSGEIATKFIQRPQIAKLTPERLKALHPALDKICLSTRKKVITLDEVKVLFPTGKLDENYITRTIKNVINNNLKTDRTVIDLTSELSANEYKIIQSFMNKENGRYINQWKGFSDTDTVPNIQKLALFARTMNFTKQTHDFIEFNPTQWEIAFDGITRKPRETFLPILKYKINSDYVHIPLSKNKITKEAKENIDGITKFLNMFSVKKDFVAYRGDKSFRILSGIKVGNGKISLAEIIEDVSTNFKNKFNNSKFNKKDVDLFIQKFLIGKKIHQPRFMSIGMTEKSIKEYVKKIKWNIKIPAGTKGASIESYNLGRNKEAEFLGQRNGILKIIDARYCPKKDLWYFDAILEQKPVDEIIVNC